ncbi:MAG: hypothetical protein RR673_09525 [Erysipelotrichaceae bacterium]
MKAKHDLVKRVIQILFVSLIASTLLGCQTKSESKETMFIYVDDTNENTNIDEAKLIIKELRLLIPKEFREISSNFVVNYEIFYTDIEDEFYRYVTSNIRQYDETLDSLKDDIFTIVDDNTLHANIELDNDILLGALFDFDARDEMINYLASKEFDKSLYYQSKQEGLLLNLEMTFENNIKSDEIEKLLLANHFQQVEEFETGQYKRVIINQEKDTLKLTFSHNSLK